MQKQVLRSPALVLASTSRYRRELLERLQLPFETASPDVDETPLSNETAAQTSLRLAIAKAVALASRFPDALLIGSDQVALLDGVQLGKPGTHERAVAQLQAMRGRTIEFHTAVALHNAATGRTQTHTDVTRVTMRNADDAAIERYLLKEQPYDCAGSAKTEGLGIALIAAIESTDPAAIIGLPLIALIDMLNEEGVAIL
ncbi:Maf family nucleotide pyrophosphatase [Jeongeupia naejangsanensis]|uniref:7-methyl-GTP pyrophosphatase n=1 Tax=Jeongeupia naejangsanensis TaxID=613195 RepID=A0ABS2BQF8_9NEIS|nr:Maf family nucleotide pyrophosphatase [Jeongeupia naejangsanensis]MBM3117828.1 septum formation inhibitor Maf [Jeongeupia naejangsanensis]